MRRPCHRRRTLVTYLHSNIKLFLRTDEGSKDPFRINRSAITICTREEAAREERQFWLSRTPIERLQHLETLRELNYGREVLDQKVQKVFEVLERPRR
jgi:hypothetical protein